MSKSPVDQLITKIEKNEAAISTFLGASVVLVVSFVAYDALLADKFEVGFAGREPEVKVLEENTAYPVYYRVQNGENLEDISQKFYGSSEFWPEIARVNEVAGGPSVQLGKRITIPRISGDNVVVPANVGEIEGVMQIIEDGVQYVVQPGDYLSRLAEEFYGDRDRWTEIYNANRDLIPDPNALEKGVELVIPQ